MDYTLVKFLHVACAALSICGFTVRGILKLNDSDYLRKRWLRIAPHVNDSILLVCATYLAFKSHQFPLTDSWLSAKLFALIIYIGFGMVVMRFGRTRRQQLAAFMLALVSFAYMLGVALTRSPTLGV